MKSIKFKILLSSMVILVASILVISITAILGTYNSTMYALEHSLISTIDAASDLADKQLESYRSAVTILATDPVLTQEVPEVGSQTDDGRTRTEVLNEIYARMHELEEANGYEDVQVFSVDGLAYELNQSFADQPYYTVPKSTMQPYIADPLISPVTGNTTMAITAPIVSGGEFTGVVLIAINPITFSEIVQGIEVGEGSSTTIVDSQGYTIAYNDTQYVFDRYNATEEAKSDPSLQALATIEQKVIAGESGFATVTWDGIDQFVAYVPIDHSNGWGIYTMTPSINFLAQFNTSIITTIILSIVLLIASAIVIIIIAGKIAKPITLCADRLNDLAGGDLETPVPDITAQDETGILAGSTSRIISALSTMIYDINHILSEMSAGNFTVKSTAPDSYVGSFAPLKESLDNVIDKLNNTLLRIEDVSEQVNSGNSQVSLGAQSLAQGSIEQASAIEQLSATMDVVAEKVSETAHDSESAKAANDKSQQALTQSNTQMQEMVIAMGNINEKSAEISKIIKTIDDIAFQTNILSLNAAVEAARAGSAGKGFAVVADEVRNLATKSAQSAKDTAVLIEETVSVVDVGNRIATETSQSINVAIENANELSALVESIATSSREQAESAAQIKAGIDQISSVVQTNSATAEESAATSEELSGQSQILKDLVSGFTLS